jgi:benzoyl-CoA reductase/2-hydroxyglutaryl-CoA dehydratase subunit BcrC/BadD/HgdB
MEVLLLSRDGAAWWKKILYLCRKRPTPFTSLDSFIHLAPIVTLRGTQACVDYYKMLYEEVAERAERGIGAVPGERYRLLGQLPVWFKMRR